MFAGSNPASPTNLTMRGKTMKVYVLTERNSKAPIRDFNDRPVIYTNKADAFFEKDESWVVRSATLNIGDIVKK